MQKNSPHIHNSKSKIGSENIGLKKLIAFLLTIVFIFGLLPIQ